MVFSVPQPSSGSWEGRAFKAERMPAGSARVGRFDSCSDRWEMTEVTRGRSRENSSDEEVLVKLIEAGRGGKEGDGGWTPARRVTSERARRRTEERESEVLRTFCRGLSVLRRFLG